LKALLREEKLDFAHLKKKKKLNGDLPRFECSEGFKMFLFRKTNQRGVF
jgi:hypothetical protein